MFERFAPYGSEQLAALRGYRDVTLSMIVLMGTIATALSIASL